VPKTAWQTIWLDAIYNNIDTNHQILEILMGIGTGQTIPCTHLILSKEGIVRDPQFRGHA